MVEEIKDTQDSTDILISTVERLEKANAEQKANLDRQEKMYAKNMLGGVTNAGSVTQEKKEISPREYAKLVLEGKIPKKE